MSKWNVLAAVFVLGLPVGARAQTGDPSFARALDEAVGVTSAELLDAETNLTRARFESINARIDARIARVRLAHALGEVS